MSPRSREEDNVEMHLREIGRKAWIRRMLLRIVTSSGLL